MDGRKKREWEEDRSWSTQELFCDLRKLPPRRLSDRRLVLLWEAPQSPTDKPATAAQPSPAPDRPTPAPPARLPAHLDVDQPTRPTLRPPPRPAPLSAPASPPATSPYPSAAIIARTRHHAAQAVSDCLSVQCHISRQTHPAVRALPFLIKHLPTLLFLSSITTSY